jgi:hypothetical protein
MMPITGWEMAITELWYYAKNEWKLLVGKFILNVSSK